MFDIRKANIESTDILVQLWIETFTQAYEDVHSSENIQAYCAKHFTTEAARKVLTDENINCCIAYKNDQPVGFYVIKHHHCPIQLDGNSSELKQIYILASEYGTGLGKDLYAHTVNVVRNSRRNWLWLYVSDLNFRAQAFYKKLNFNPAGIGPTFEVGTDHLTSTVMVLKIS